MAVVHRETNWGAHAGTANHFAQSNPAICRPPNGTATDAVCSNSDAACPTIEIAVELAEARDVTVVAVTTDQELRAALGELLRRDGILFADSAEEVLSRPVPNNCAVLVVEQTLSRSTLSQLKAHLKESGPALVSIMVGTDSNGSSLVAQLSAGHIDRFMVKPFKFGPTRSALRSALQQHHSLRQCAQVERTAAPGVIESALAVESTPGIAPRAHVLRTQAKAKRGPQTDTMRSAKHTIAGIKQQPAIEERHGAERHKAELKGELDDATDEVIAISGESKIRRETRNGQSTLSAVTARRFSLPSWGLAFAAAIAVLGFIVFGIFARTPELNKDRVIAGHLAAAHRSFELRSYVDPPELSAAHFYSAALELDPMNAEARRGLEAVADRLIADGKELIVAGDLLRAQSTLDNVRRIQPNHRELADATASLLSSREAERAMLQAAHATTKESAEPIAPKFIASAPSRAAQAEVPAPVVAGRAPAGVQPKISNSPQRTERLVRIDSPSIGGTGAASVGRDVSSSIKSLEKMHAAGSIPVTGADASLTLNQAPLELPKRTEHGRTEERQSLDSAQNESAMLGVPKLVSVPAKNSTDAITGAETGSNNARPTNTGQIATRSVSVDRVSFSEASDNNATSANNGETKLVRYVAPVYPYTARVERAEGWLDVHFLVASDGSVINPRIEKGSLDSAFRRAAIAAVAQWKYSAAVNGSAPNRPMNVRVRFQLADAKHT